MIAHGQLVYVVEGLKRQHPQSALPHFRKNRVAELLEAHSHQTRHSVGDSQTDGP